MNFLLAEAGAFAFGMADVLVFVGFIVAVILVSTLMSRSAGKSSEDYFLAGRGLPWWLIGFSLIAANISAEQFVGMSGNAAMCTGLAIASFEWIAAITLVGVAFIFLPMFLRCGIYTIPEFLEYRYNKFARSLLSLFMMVILVGVSIAAVIYLGALTIDTLFHGTMVCGIEVNVITASWVLGFLAAVYVFIGGLKACAWADLIQGSALILGGVVVMLYAFSVFGKTPLADMQNGATPIYLRPAAYQTGEGADMFSGITDDTPTLKKFMTIDQDVLHMLRPLSDPNIVWTTLLFGIWIPNFYYWGLNQYIMQRTLGSKSLAEGQKGIVFAAAMKLIIPFIVVIPGILAFDLYSDQMAMEAENDEMANKPVLAQFDRLVAGNPEATDNAKTVFKFNREFAVLQPEKAAAIAKFNQATLGHTADFDAALASHEETIRKENKFDMDDALAQSLAIQSLNTEQISAAAGSGCAVSKELIGYKYDAAFPLLLKNLPFPNGVKGFVLAALFGAVMSSLASMLNAASTIFTMDIFNEYIKKDASQGLQVFVGRACVVVFAVIACLIVPILADPKFGGLFKYIQEFQGYLSPGVLVVFLYGLVSKKVPGFAGGLTILLSPIVYGALKYLPSTASMNYLNQMAITFFVLWGLMFVLNMVCPRKEEIRLEPKGEMDLTSSKGAAWAGIVVVVLTVGLYAYFW
ncbi:MAG: sodium/solute symporter [Planctomycetia bacterium]|nr:sodium/solute symporter [Planctomycetia bacterium]